MDPLPDRLGRYVVHQVVQQGRRFAVVRGRQDGIPRDLALKLAACSLDPAARRQARALLLHEARLRAAFDHPGLLPLYGLERTRQGTLLVGPWLGGGTVTERWRQQAPVPEILAFVAQMGDALDVLHAAGWLHGDLSPRNILLDAAGRPRLIDLASCAPLGARWGADPAGAWPVTRVCAAPELLAGAPLDGRADLYALGAILTLALTGAWPGAGEGSAAPLAPSARCPALSPAVDRVLLAALAPDPDARPESGRALSLALHAAFGATAENKTSLFESPPQISDAAAARAQAALDRALSGLPTDQQAALRAVFDAIQRQDSQAQSDLTRQLGALVAPVAALHAAETLGLLHALGAGPRPTDALARELDLQPAPTERLCRYLAATGALRTTAAGWGLRPPYDAVYRAARRLGRTVQPVQEQLSRWGGLAAWARTGAPGRLLDGDDGGAAYAGPAAALGDRVADLAARLGDQLQEKIAAPARILDLGAGSAVWSLALAARWPEARVTALDRPQVLDLAEARARGLGLSARFERREGDLDTLDLPPASWDLIVAAQVCHLVPAAALPALIARLAQALAPGGHLLIIEPAPDHLDQATEPDLRYDLGLGLRTRGGALHDLESYQSACAAADLAIWEIWTIAPDRRLRVLLASG